MNLPAMRPVVIALVSAAGLCTVALAERDIKPQPDLAVALDAAPQLEFEDLAPGPDACWEGPLWWVPNPDGKTWDTVFIYSKGYQGPHEVFAYDTATKELKKFEVPGPCNSFHINPYLLIGDKLLIKPGIGAEDVSLWVYDPAINPPQGVQFRREPAAADAGRYIVCSTSTWPARSSSAASPASRR